jgi:hypothetical protein
VNITAKQFYDLVALCFAWRWNPDRPSSAWGTIHAANWLLFHAGAYDGKIRDIFARDSNVAHLFCAHNNVYPAKGVHDVVDEIWSDDRHFLILVPADRQFQRSRLLGRNGYKIVLTAVGQQYALGLEQQYAPILTREEWEAAREQRNSFFRRTNSSRRATIEDAAMLREEEGD